MQINPIYNKHEEEIGEEIEITGYDGIINLEGLDKNNSLCGIGSLLFIDKQLVLCPEVYDTSDITLKRRFISSYCPVKVKS